MNERLKAMLGALEAATPDKERIRERVLARNSLPRVQVRSVGLGRALTVAVSLAVAISSFVLVVRSFDRSAAPASAPDGEERGTTTGGGGNPLDPAAVCELREYDPTVALLVGSRTAEYPLSLLQQPGLPIEDIQGPAADALRMYVKASRNAPADGWRSIDSTHKAAMFAAPSGTGDAKWWLVTFRSAEEGWKLASEEIADQEPTPAQRGHGLTLSWREDVTLVDGEWNSPLVLSNQAETAWVVEGAAYWGIPYILDPSSGRVVSAAAPSAGSSGTYSIPAGQSVMLPLALAGVISSLAPGDYDIIACIPELGLASPPSVLHVQSAPAELAVGVATYRSTPGGMTAAIAGTLVSKDGCLAVASDSTTTYLVLPETLTLLIRRGVPTLVTPTGTLVGALGDYVRLAGGRSTVDGVEGILQGDVPGHCRVDGERYFAVSDPDTIIGATAT